MSYTDNGTLPINSDFVCTCISADNWYRSVDLYVPSGVRFFERNYCCFSMTIVTTFSYSYSILVYHNLSWSDNYTCSWLIKIILGLPKGF